MAISVKQFKNLLDCPEPQYQINVAYNSDAQNGGSEICAGNFTSTDVYGDFASLSDLYTQGATGNASTSDICEEGMDVVFCIDYTGSMSGAINGVKSGISQIAAEIATLSNNNYRLGLVTFDGSSTTSSGHYASSLYYQNLPQSQRHVGPNPHGSGNLYITCQELMALNNIGDSTTGFTKNLNSIATGVGGQGNSAIGMSLGENIECGGQATYDISQGFAGQWRADVLKIIIVITDDKSEENAAYFANTVVPALDNQNIQVFHNTSLTSTGSNPQNAIDNGRYKAAVNDTTPAGLYISDLVYTQTWYTNLITGIQNLCEETTTYTCDPAPAGWYADVPIVAGSTVAYYWDGSAWTNSYACPAPQYVVDVDIVDAINNGSVDAIPILHPNYLDSDTLRFGPAVANTQFSATIQCSVDSGWQNLSLSVSNISDTFVITSASVNNGTLEVTIQVTIGSNSSAESMQINGTASQVQRTLTLDIIGGAIDSTDADGNSQTPAGYIVPIPVDPINNWQSVNQIYGNFAERYVFEGVANSTHTVDLEFDRSPSDYTLNVTGTSIQGYNASNSGGPQYTPAINAMSNVSLTSGNQDQASYDGIITMPNEDVYVRVYITGQVDQPDYRFTVYASETIIGASIIGASSTTFLGYTDEEFNFSKLLQLDPGYTNLNITSVIANTNYTGNSAISNIQATPNNDGGQCLVTMPASSGGSAGIIIDGTADAIDYDYVITINDAFSQASWSQVTLTGPIGSAQSTTATSINNAGYSFNATSISGAPAGLNATISNNTSMEIGLTLMSMPLGGGSATITVNGSQTQNTYNYNLSIQTDNPVSGSWASSSTTLTGAAGDVIPGTFTFNQSSNTQYTSTGHSTPDTEIQNLSYTGVNQLFSTNYEVVMPLGGGSGVITCDDATSSAINYTYYIHFDDSQLNNNGNMSLSPISPIAITAEQGTIHNLSYCLTPSPSYWEVAIQTANVTTHDGSGNTGTANELQIGTIAGNNPTCIYFSLEMPQGGGTGYIRPKGSINEPKFDMVVTGVTQISNTNITGTNPITLTAPAGTTVTHTFDVLSDPGYTHDVTSVNVSNAYNGGVTASPTVADDVLVSVTMPVGGGNTTVTAVGTSQTSVAFMNFNFAEDPSIANEGQWDNNSLQFSGAPNTTHNMSNIWRSSPKVWGAFSQSSYTIVDTSSGLTGSPFPSSGAGRLRQLNTVQGGNSSSIAGTFTMPSQGGNYTITFNVTRLQNPPCECIDTYPPLITAQPEVNGNNNGSIEINFTAPCFSVISTISTTKDGVAVPLTHQNATISSNNNSYTWYNLEAADYAFTIQYDDCTVCCDSHTITQTLTNQIQTTSTTTGDVKVSPGDDFGDPSDPSNPNDPQP